tara:strand:+ start:30482 stop:31441 length:960 start_codon:yes stop_codon:yes gene_type:complete
LKNPINFVYCIDDNYNLQTASSILSLLENVSEKINVFILHKTKSDSSFLPVEILENKKLNKIKVLKFNRNKKSFPNVEGKHVSEATYYRLYLEDYISPSIYSINFITYLDGDVICLKDPIAEIRKTINDMDQQGFAISVNTETIRNSELEHRFNSLGMKSNKYFNAGVMVINLNKWCELDIKEKSIEIIDKKSQHLELWDQDVLNACFDSNYFSLSSHMNYRFDMLKFDDFTLEEINNNVTFLHYYGSTKPWSMKGIIYGYPHHYLDYFKKLRKAEYHITHKWKRLSFSLLIGSFFDLRFFKIKNRIRFLRDALISFIS